MGGTLEEWIVAEPVDAALGDRVRMLLVDTLPGHVRSSVSFAAPFIRIVVQVPDDEVQALAIDLDDVEAPVLEAWSEWQDDIVPPRDGSHYQLVVELCTKQPETFESIDGELSILSVYSKDGDNNEAWPTAFVLGARIARLLGAQEPEQMQLAN